MRFDANSFFFFFVQRAPTKSDAQLRNGALRPRPVDLLFYFELDEGYGTSLFGGKPVKVGNHQLVLCFFFFLFFFCFSGNFCRSL